jgi:hypothetical protein
LSWGWRLGGLRFWRWRVLAAWVVGVLAIQKLLFQVQFQQRGNQHGIKLDRDPLLIVTNEVNTVQGPFQKSKKQFNIPLRIPL